MLSKIIQRLKRAGGAKLKRRDRSFEVESDPIYAVEASRFALLRPTDLTKGNGNVH